MVFSKADRMGEKGKACQSHTHLELARVPSGLPLTYAIVELDGPNLLYKWMFVEDVVSVLA